MELVLRLERLLWSGPLLVGLMGSHLYFTVRLRGVQRLTLRGIHLSLRGGRGENGVSSFGALATSLAAAIGTGNIIGVATAVALGGPGAVLWCWLTGVLGMATRYAEAYLTLKYRRVRDGQTLGGPMYVLEDRLHMPSAARCFALLGVAAAVGTGALIQSNAVGTALMSAAHIPPLLSGTVLTFLAGMVILGGVRSISAVSEKLVPAMSALYLLGCAGVLWSNREILPETLRVIVSGAFSLRSAGGGLAGSAMLLSARYGVARGLFTNESGMGTAPMAAAAAPCDDPVREALVSMTGVFWDTVVICAVTGLALVSSMLRFPAMFRGAEAGNLCALAFSQIPMGRWILTLSLTVFAFATIVGWCWYGECCWRYLSGRSLIWYRGLYLSAVFAGVFGGLDLMWSLGSVLAGLMAVPNLICLWRLRDEAAASAAEFEKSCCFSRRFLYNGSGRTKWKGRVWNDPKPANRAGSDAGPGLDAAGGLRDLRDLRSHGQ